MKILIGDISSYKAIVIAKFIKNYYPDITIYSFDTRNFTRSIKTKYVDKNFIVKGDIVNSCYRLIEDYNIDYFFPVINAELKSIWKHKSMFKESLSYLGNFDSFTLLNDKSKLGQLAQKLNIRAPKIYENIDLAEYPFVVKPTDLSSSEGVIYVENKNDLRKINRKDKTIAQEYVNGTGVGYSFYCKDGEIKAGYGHRRLAEYPVTGGSSTYREEFKDSRMVDISKKIVQDVNYTGFAMFEFLLTTKDELYLLEVNPRIWGSVNQGLTQGVNYFGEILGPTQKLIEKSKKDYKTYIGPLVYASLLKYGLILNFKPLLKFIKNIHLNVPDVSLIVDPMGYASIIFRKLKLK